MIARAAWTASTRAHGLGEIMSAELGHPGLLLANLPRDDLNARSRDLGGLLPDLVRRLLGDGQVARIRLHLDPTLHARALGLQRHDPRLRRHEVGRRDVPIAPSLIDRRRAGRAGLPEAREALKLGVGHPQPRRRRHPSRLRLGQARVHLRAPDLAESRCRPRRQ